MRMFLYGFDSSRDETLLFFVSFAMTSCGKIPIGTSPNDPIPSGSPVAQGVFTSSPAHAVSGIAVIYDQGGGTFVVRLSNFSAPQETGLRVRGVLSTGTNLTVAALRAYSGNQNYTVTTSASATWQQVTIYSPSALQDYGIALLQ